MNTSSAASDNQNDKFEAVAGEKCIQYSLESVKSASNTLPRGEKGVVIGNTKKNRNRPLKLPRRCIRVIQTAALKPLVKDKLLWICHELQATGASTKDGAPLNQHYFQSLLGMRGRDLLDRLITLGLVEKCGNHSQGRKCARYRFTSPIRNTPNLGPAKLQSERLRKNRSSREHRAKAELAAARYPIKILEDLKMITATPEFLTAFDDYLAGMEREGKMVQPMKALRNTWKKGAVQLSVKDSRITSHVARTPSELRKLLRINGEPVVELDFPNSHPAILAAIFAPTEQSTDEEIKKHAGFVRLVQAGEFYEVFEHCWLQDRWHFAPFAVAKSKLEPELYPEAKADFLTLPPRKGIKLCWQLIINCGKRFHETNIMGELSSALPEFERRLWALKSSGQGFLGKELRRREAQLIANLARATKEPCATIYDGLLTNQKGAEDILQSCPSVTMEHLGFEHQLKVKEQTPPYPH